MAPKTSCGTTTPVRIDGSFRRFLVATIRPPRSRCLRRGQGASRLCRPKLSRAVIRAARITPRANANSATPATGMSSGTDAPRLVALVSVRMTNFRNRRIPKIALVAPTTQQIASRHVPVRSRRRRHPGSAAFRMQSFSGHALMGMDQVAAPDGFHIPTEVRGMTAIRDSSRASLVAQLS